MSYEIAYYDGRQPPNEPYASGNPPMVVSYVVEADDGERHEEPLGELADPTWPDCASLILRHRQDGDPSQDDLNMVVKALGEDFHEGEDWTLRADVLDSLGV